MSNGGSVSGDAGARTSPIRIEGRITQIVTMAISLALIVAWSIYDDLPVDWIITLVIVSAFLGIVSIRLYRINIAQEGDFILYIRPGFTWTLASQAMLGASIIFAAILYFVNTSVSPSGPLRMFLVTLVLILIIIFCPVLPLLSTIHPRWLKSVFAAQMSPPFSLNVERASIFDRFAQQALMDRSLLIPLEEKWRESSG